MHLDALARKLMKKSEDKSWDIIPDVHGQRGKLESLLTELGYEKFAGVYRHPERRILFLGDYIDRGPDIRGVLQTVRSMVDAGEAVALMGNHELNALHFHHLSPDGQPLRPHKEDKVEQHADTLEQFARREDEWRDWLKWFKTLPWTFETDEFRAVHACWDDNAREAIEGRSLTDEQCLVASAQKGSREYWAFERLLKGPEVDLPQGTVFHDRKGQVRSSLRVRWWDLEAKDLSLKDVVMPPGAKSPDHPFSRAQFPDVQSYEAHKKPVLFGHYQLQPRAKVEPLAANILCLDFSADKEGPLVACRWGGTLANSEFVAIEGSNGSSHR